MLRHCRILSYTAAKQVTGLQPRLGMVIQTADFYDYPPVIPKHEMPENRKLKIMPRAPPLPNYGKPPKMMRYLKIMRGPEPIHNSLLYKQFGVIAKTGGRMAFEHFECIRLGLNKRLDIDRMFALWRVDAPWQPVTKKGLGKRMGGGKPNIHHYVSPFKADRVIVELAGDLDWQEAVWILHAAVHKLPFKAEIVSHETLEKRKEYKKWVEQNNLNPYTMKYAILNNMGGCHNWLSPYDYKHFGEYP